MSISLPSCACKIDKSHPVYPRCNNTKKKENKQKPKGVGADRVNQVAEALSQGTLRDVDGITFTNDPKKALLAEFELWTLEEVSLFLTTWIQLCPEGSTVGIIEEDDCDMYAMVNCPTRNGMIYQIVIARHEQMEKCIPIVRNLVPDIIDERKVENAIDALRQDPISLFMEYGKLARATNQTATHTKEQTDEICNEMIKWINRREIEKARIKCVRRLRSHVLLFGLHGYATISRAERLATEQEDDDADDDADGMWEELAGALDQAEYEDDEEDDAVDLSKIIPNKTNDNQAGFFSFLCGCFDSGQKLSTMPTDQPVLTRASSFKAKKPKINIYDQIHLTKLIEFANQGGNWKEHVTSEGAPYFYEVKNEDLPEGGHTQVPTGKVSLQRPPQTRDKNTVEFKSWEELACKIGEIRRSKRKNGLGVRDRLVQHIFKKFQGADKVVHLDAIRPGLAHLLCIGFGPLHKLRMAFELTTMPALHQKNNLTEDANAILTCGPNEWLTQSQFITMYKSLTAYTVYFPNFLEPTRSPKSGEAVIKDAKRLFRQINTNYRNKYITLNMILRYAVTHPTKFWPMGIHICDNENYWQNGTPNSDACDYTVPRGQNFSVQESDDVEHVIRVLDALALINRASQSGFLDSDQFPEELQKGTICLDSNKLKAACLDDGCCLSPRHSGKGEPEDLDTLADCEIFIHMRYYTEQICEAYGFLPDGTPLVEKTLKGKEFEQGDSLLGRLMFSDACLRRHVYKQLVRGATNSFKYAVTTLEGERRLFIETISKDEKDNLLNMFEKYTEHMMKHKRQSFSPNASKSPRTDGAQSLLPAIFGFYSMEFKYEGEPMTAYFIISKDPLCELYSLKLKDYLPTLVKAVQCSNVYTVYDDRVTERKFCQSNSEREADFEDEQARTGSEQSDPIMTQLRADAAFLVGQRMDGWNLEVKMHLDSCGPLNLGVQVQTLSLESNQLIAQMEVNAARANENNAKKENNTSTKSVKGEEEETALKALSYLFDKDDLIEYLIEKTCDDVTDETRFEQKAMYRGMFKGAIDEPTARKQVAEGVALPCETVLPRLAAKLLDRVEQIGCVSNQIFLSPNYEDGDIVSYPDADTDPEAFDLEELYFKRKLYIIKFTKFFSQSSQVLDLTPGDFEDYGKKVIDNFSNAFPTS